jgi:putative oxidoreductase
MYYHHNLNTSARTITMKTTFQKLGPWAELGGRFLIAFIFITSGWSKVGGFEGTQAYMEAMGVPGVLLPLAIVTELAGGLMIVFGLFTRYAAIALAGFTVLSAILFHGGAEQVDQIMFVKNLAIAGGFLFLLIHGAGKISLDRRLGRA